MVSFQVAQALRALKSGGVIAYPTEGVWGLGCDPFDAVAVARILMLKQRALSKGLILVAAYSAQFSELLYALDVKEREILQQSWPGAHTFVVPDPEQRLPFWLRGEHHSIALRVSAHPQIQTLCRNFGPLVSTSANPAGLPAATSLLKIQQYFHGQLDYILAGRVMTPGKPTSIYDLRSAKQLRV